jgi:predicted nucleotidyltransferase component of viral defense system
MTIQDVIKECVIALFSNKSLKDSLVLKGGAALSLSEKLYNRLSTDIDFSVESDIAKPETFFKKTESALKSRFKRHDLEVFDFKYEKRPRKRSTQKPHTWGGWLVTFKQIKQGRKFKTIEQKRREAIIPEGHNSSKINLEFSEHEYCGLTRQFKLGGILVKAYDPVILVVEKLRAICQQHASYPHSRAKNRARDYFDIYELVKKHRSDRFFKKIKNHIEPVFDAKQVDTGTIQKIFETDFLEFQENGFEAVKDVVSEVPGGIQEFDFYVDQLKLLLKDVGINMK